MVTTEMKELLKTIANLTYQASEEVWDDNNKNGTGGILHTCDELCQKIDNYLDNDNT